MEKLFLITILFLPQRIFVTHKSMIKDTNGLLKKRVWTQIHPTTTLRGNIIPYYTRECVERVRGRGASRLAQVGAAKVVPVSSSAENVFKDNTIVRLDGELA